MPKDVPVAPYHDPDYQGWIWEQEEFGLYPQRIPAQHYLGWAINSCKWDGRGFFYEPWPKSDEVSRIMRVCGGKVAAGNRLPRIRTALYRLFNATDELLYVGITDTPERRFIEHSKDKPWWPEVANSSIEWLGNRRLALATEEVAIRTEKPKYNVVHNSRVAA